MNRENEAEAAWKNTEELKYNLQSKYMEQEDKWKKSLGPELYKEKASILNVDTQSRQRLTQYTKESVISREEANGIAHLLFKDGKGHIHDSWRQGFFFD